jgi:hypothetical protein
MPSKNHHPHQTIGWLVLDDQHSPKAYSTQDGMLHRAGRNLPVTVFKTRSEAWDAMRRTYSYQQDEQLPWNVEQWTTQRVATVQHHAK